MNKELIDLIKEIRVLDAQGEAYLSTIPTPFDMILVENDFQIANYKIQNILMRQVFGNTYEDICWFLYEWKPGYSIKTQDGVEYTFNTEEDYYKYLERV